MFDGREGGCQKDEREQHARISRRNSKAALTLFNRGMFSDHQQVNFKILSDEKIKGEVVKASLYFWLSLCLPSTPA